MRGISRQLIESIAVADNSEFAQEIEQKVNTLVSLAVEDMSHSIPFVSVENCVLQPVTENFSGALTPESEYVYFLGFMSPQIELNCIQYNDSWKKFKERLVFAWNNSKKPKKRKKRKKNEDVSSVKEYEYETEKYNLDSLKDDLQKAFVKNLITTSIVYNNENNLRIIGRDEFGPKTQIYIYPCLLEGDDYKFFISRKKGFYKVNFLKRAELINEKLERVGYDYITMIKIFNSLFRSTSKYSVMPNQIFIESLLYNVPDELFEGNDIYDNFIKIVNYLNLTDVSEFKSIANPELKINEDKLTKSNQVAFLKFINSLDTINS